MAWPFRSEHEELRRSLRAAFSRGGDVPAAEELLDGVEGDALASVALFEEWGRAGRVAEGRTVATRSDQPGLATAALASGGATRAFELAMEYSKGRRAFGRPISKHQAVRHMVASMYVEARAAEALLHHTAAAREPELIRLVAACVPTMAWSVVDRALQVFGGHGYARASEIHRLWTDLALLRSSAGDLGGSRASFESELFTAEHQSLREEVRSFVEHRLAPNADDWDAAEGFPREIFKEAGKAGVFGWKYPEDVGGRGRNFIADAVVTEELTAAGAGGVAAAFGAHKDLGCLYLYNFGSPEQHERWLKPALAGDVITALAVTEPDAGSDVASLRSSARRDGSGWILDGTKTFITNGAWADVVVVAAKTDQGAGHAGLTLFVVERNMKGFSSQHVPMLGWRPSQTGELVFDGVRVPDEARLGEEGSGFYAIMQNFAWERLVMAIAQGASGERLLRDISGRSSSITGDVLSLNARHQAARALTYSVLRSVAAGGSPLADVAGAKWMTSETAFEAATARHVLAPDERSERALRDLRLGPIGGGTSEIMKEIVGRVLGL